MADFRFSFSFFAIVVISVVVNFAFGAPRSGLVRSFYRDKTTVFFAAVLGLGVSCSPVFCRWCTMLLVLVRQVLLFRYYADGFPVFGEGFTIALDLVVSHSIRLVTFDIGMF